MTYRFLSDATIVDQVAVGIPSREPMTINNIYRIFLKLVGIFIIVVHIAFVLILLFPSHTHTLNAGIAVLYWRFV